MKFLTRAEKTFQVFNYMFLTLISVIMIAPVWHVLMYSFSDSWAVNSTGFFIWPRDFSLRAYTVVMRNSAIYTAYKNTIYVVIMATSLNLVMTLLFAYPLCKKDLDGRRIIQFGIFFTMLFSGGLIPTYLVVNKLGLTNTHWSLIIPSAISTYNVFVLRNFIATSIPDSLLESARIDGASETRILFQIVVPLSKPVLAVLGLWYGVGHWNSWFACIIYITKFNLYTLQPVLRQILTTMSPNAVFNHDPMLDSYQLAEVVKMAMIVVATVPILCVYPFLQKYFVKGVVLGAVKG